ncbi:MAG: type I-U CRISPR-associated protein Cas7 [Alphaproteobacteria bacterium]|nr:type I-U CRISPR-associated protein Cas7 [Alphaproteobacteria bacterium]
MNFAQLTSAVASDAAIRRRQRLQPAGGQGDKIFPPTYPEERRGEGPRHVFERRRIGGAEVWCALIDSVQSQANRLEESLLAASRDGVAIPHLSVDFRGKGLTGIDEITSLDAPHRVFDAILRDSLLDGGPFMKSALGQRLTDAKSGDASALLETSPTALLFGVWNSTGEGGGLGAKFPRALVSEIIAVNTPVEEFGEAQARTAGRRTGSRMDPLGVLRKVEVWQSQDDKSWSTSKDGLKKPKQVRPSEINHGNIAPTVAALGVTCDYAEHTAVISFAGLRRLGFGSAERNAAGRAYLAALGLLALTEQDLRGYDLRSRCALVCDGLAPLQHIRPDGSATDVTLDAAAARALYGEAFKAAKAAGFALSGEPVRLTPQDKLVSIVKQSQEMARQGEGGEEASEG